MECSRTLRYGPRRAQLGCAHDQASPCHRDPRPREVHTVNPISGPRSGKHVHRGSRCASGAVMREELTGPAEAGPAPRAGARASAGAARTNGCTGARIRSTAQAGSRGSAGSGGAADAVLEPELIGAGREDDASGTSTACDPRGAMGAKERLQARERFDSLPFASTCRGPRRGARACGATRLRAGGRWASARPLPRVRGTADDRGARLPRGTGPPR